MLGSVEINVFVFVFLKSTNISFFSVFSPHIQSLVKMYELTKSRFPNKTCLSLFFGNCDCAPQFHSRSVVLPLILTVKEQHIP